MKKMRGRGGRGGRGNGFDSRGGFEQTNGQPAGMLKGFPAMPNMPGMPQFDPNDPMGAIMAMQAMGLPPLPGMDGLLPQQIGAPRSPGFNQNGGKGICRDYVNKGYCTRGDSCPYQHANPVVMPRQSDGESFYPLIVIVAKQYLAEYDPKDSLMTSGPFPPTSIANENHLNNQLPLESYPNESRGRGRASDRGRGRGRGGNDQGGFRKSSRAEFSHAGPSHDRSITSIVVKQIPEEKFFEEAVRQFFSEFGTIEEITLQPYKRLAIVKYSDYSSARAAYDSPKVIFNNRFVKVYWYKPGSVPTPTSGPTAPLSTTNNDTPLKDSAPTIDMEAFTAAATAAQAKLDAKKAALVAMSSKREALEKQKADLAAKQDAEKQKLLNRLAAKGESLHDSSNNDPTTTTTAASFPPSQTNSPTTPKAADSAHTLMLRAKVAELEAEAKRRGLPDSALSSNDPTHTFTPRGRGRSRGHRGGGRGSYRGWEAFDPSSSYRGGRGGSGAGGSPFVPGRGGGGGKYNLDLRTKRVAVTLPPSGSSEHDEEKDGGGGKWTAEKDEALRQHLLGVGEFEDIVPLAPERESGAGTLVVGFKDRGTAEGFFYGMKGKEVPGLGKVGVSWFNGPASLAGESGSGKKEDGGDVDMGNGAENGIGYGEEDGEKKSSEISNGDGNANGNGLAAMPEMRGGHGEVGGLGEGDYDVAEEDDDSWMT